MKRLAALLLFVVSATLAEEGSIPKNCHGLHAGITAEVVSTNTENHVVLAFLLLNDSDSPRDVGASSWKIVIDGNELKDSGWLLFNGPQPVGGWRMLEPGQHYAFGKSLPIPEYFPRGEHKVSWRGNGFQSPTLTIKTDAPSH